MLVLRLADWCLSGGEVTKHEYGMTIVDLNNLGYRDEPFVLAQYVGQVFYIKDMSSKPKKGINKKRMSLSDT